MATWIISGWLHFAAGLAAGWIVFKRPEWIERGIAWLKQRAGL